MNANCLGPAHSDETQRTLRASGTERLAGKWSTVEPSDGFGTAASQLALVEVIYVDGSRTSDSAEHQI
jgi:hypothetical protein